MGAGGRGGPASRDLHQQARPRALRLPGHAGSARVLVREPGRARSSSPSAPSTSSRAWPTCSTRRRTCTPTGRRREESEWPEEIHAMADPAREKLIEAVAESDDALIEEYLEEGHAARGAHRLGREGRVRARAPRAGDPGLGRARRSGSTGCWTSSSRSSPRRWTAGRSRSWARAARSRSAPATRPAPTTAFVFKTISDPFVGHITMFRVFSGTVRPDSSLHNATQGTDERVGQLFTLTGQGPRRRARGPRRRHRRRREARPRPHGRHLQHEGRPGAAPGDRAARNRCSPTRSRPRPRATRTSSPRGSRACARRIPTLRVTRNEETHETVMHGMGEAHLEVMIERLKRKFGVEVETGAGQDRLPRDDRGKPPRRRAAT